MFLNQITVLQRGPNELKRVAIERVEVEDDGRFRLERSVFRIYQEDSTAFLESLLRQDIKYSKIKTLCKSDRDFVQVSETLQKHYQSLKSIFLYYAANSTTYPALASREIQGIAVRSKLFDRNHLNLNTLDRAIIATKVSGPPTRNPASRDLHRFEFMELIVRIAQVKYRDSKIALHLHEAIETLVTRDLLPNNPQLNGMAFRTEHLYFTKVNELLKKNAPAVKTLYEANVSAVTQYMTIEGAQSIAEKANLNITPQKVKECYVASLASRVDTIKDASVAE